jgi:hypothetical protein
VLHGEDYLPNHFLNPALEQAEANLNQAYVADAANTEQLPVGSFQDTPVHSALLFGWKSRDTGHWEFWLQTRARVDFTTGNGTSSRYVLSGLTQFWPGQFNQLVVSGRDTRNVRVKLLAPKSMPHRL